MSDVALAFLLGGLLGILLTILALLIREIGR
jgi:hypothetical protein